MSLGRKVAVLFLVLGLSLCAGSYVALKMSVLPAFEDIERDYASNALARVARALDAELRAIEIMNMEYSSWDHTYEYVQGLRPEFEDENLDPVYWQSIDIDLMLIFDRQGNPVFARITDPTTDEALQLDGEFHGGLSAGDPLIAHQDPTSSVKGLLRTRSGLMLIVSYPVLRGDRAGPVIGSLVVGRFLVADRVAELAEQATTNLLIYPATWDDKSLRPAAAGEQSGSGVAVRVETVGDTVRIRQALLDIHGAPAGTVEVRMPRRITRIASGTIQAAMLFVAAASAVFMLAALVFMRRLIVTPLNELTAQILSIGQTGRLRFEAQRKRSDEIGVLAGEFANMTAGLAEARSELEHARDEALAMSRAKSEFLARMSHEIRTPMNGVLGMTELLNNTPLNDKQQRFARNIYASAESLLSIINDILDFSKMGAGKLLLDTTEVSLRAIVEETVESLAGQAHVKGLELIAVLPPDFQVTVLADPVRLRQVLTNLLGNAIKFTEHGEVLIRVSASETGPDQLRVQFEVSDTGIGIGPDKHAEIFDSFTQEDGTTTRIYGGTGLGLAISRQLVDLMGGEISVRSTPGQGSTFSFELSLEKGSGQHCATSPAPAQQIAGRRILIVDDNATNREIFEHQLESWRANSDSAVSAEQALQILESAAAAGQAHELAILDMHMPHRDGLDLARAIRRNPALAALRLVILSSMPEPASDEQLARLRIAGQLTKPVRQAELYNTLVAILSGERIPQRSPALRSATNRGLSGRILLAEDNPVNQIVALGMLESMGLTADVAPNGRVALQQAASSAYDIILMDCQMPLMDGFEATRCIRRQEVDEARPQTPIIAVTANALKGDKEKCQAAGMTDYLSKPFTTEQLHAVIARFLPASAHRGAAPLEPAPAHSGSPALAIEQAPAIDRSVLGMLAELQQPGAPDLLQDIIGTYLENSQQLQARLGGAVEAADQRLVAESAHALKSSSANVGATRLAELCRQLESISRGADLSGALSLRAQIDAEYAEVVASLEREIAA